MNKNFTATFMFVIIVLMLISVWAFLIRKKDLVGFILIFIALALNIWLLRKNKEKMDKNF